MKFSKFTDSSGAASCANDGAAEQVGLCAQSLVNSTGQTDMLSISPLTYHLQIAGKTRQKKITWARLQAP